MDDYISREAAIKIAQRYGLANGSVLGRHSGLADCIAIEIEGLPAADVEPVRHGRWMQCDEDWDMDYTVQCSFCHEKWYFSDKIDLRELNYNYCPNCGAKMDLI